MAERFRDSIKAAQYLSQGLHHDFPDGEIEVIRLQRGKPKHSICSMAQAERVLVEACRGLDAVNVAYHPGNAYGFVAEISANGVVSAKTPGAHEGNVYVLIRQVKGRPLAVGSRAISRAALDLD
jgi:hypothetical protein